MAKPQDQQPISGTYSRLFEIGEKKRKEAQQKQKEDEKKAGIGEEKETKPSPTPAREKPFKQERPKPKKIEKKERQLNAWISASQNGMLDQLYFRLRAKGVRIKKGELVGVALEILSRILEKKEPRNIDSSILDSYVESSSKKGS